MVITRKYQLEKNCKFYEHLVAMGIAEDKARLVDNLKPIMEITEEKNKLTLISHNGVYTNQSNLIFDEEVEEKVGIGINLKSVAVKLDENTIEIRSRTDGDRTGKRRLEFTEQDLIMTIESDTNDFPVATRYYKRIENKEHESDDGNDDDEEEEDDDEAED